MTVADGTYTAVLDRLEEGPSPGDRLAVLVLEADGEAVDQLVVDVAELPADGRAPDTVLEVVVEDGALVSAGVAADETEARAERAADRFERLSRPLSGQRDASGSGGEDADASDGAGEGEGGSEEATDGAPADAGEDGSGGERGGATGGAPDPDPEPTGEPDPGPERDGSG